MRMTTGRGAGAALAVALAAVGFGPAVAAVLGPAGQTLAAQGPARYWVYVANESSDLVSRVRFDGTTLVEERAVTVGFHPTDLDGAHGVAVDPKDGFVYISIAHGRPYGYIWQMRAGTEEFVDTAQVGLFPATMAVSADGTSLYVVNFNLHGDPLPSSVSAVFTPVMTEVAQVETCVMPHGSRLSRDGLRHYSTCMMSDQLVEISVTGPKVARRMRLTADREGVLAPDDPAATRPVMGAGVCKPTWVVPSPDDRFVYVPCNGRGDVLEIEQKTLTVRRTFPAGRAPYNADVTPDGSLLVVTLKGEQAVAVYDLASGTERARIPTTQPVTHGVVVSPDGRYAFVTNEAVGAVRGTLDVVDLERDAIVASLPLHYQPGGIGFWKMEKGGS